MAVEINFGRKAVELSYDKRLCNGPFVDVVIRNPDNEDVSVRNRLPNDGLVVITVPENYHGEAYVTVHGSGKSKDEGLIEF